MFATPSLREYVNARTRAELEQFVGAERAAGLGDGALRGMAYMEITRDAEEYALRLKARFDSLDPAYDSAATNPRDAVLSGSRSGSEADSASACEDLAHWRGRRCVRGAARARSRGPRISAGAPRDAAGV